MAQTNQFIRYVGGAVALVGLALSAAFVGRRTAGALASWFIQPLTIWWRILGVLVGLIIIGVGLAIVGRAGEQA
jgi:hypothetical protein